MEKMLKGQNRRVMAARPRPRTLLLLVFASITAWYILFSGPSTGIQVVPYLHDETPGRPASVPAVQESTADSTKQTAPAAPKPPKQKPFWDVDIDQIRNWQDPTDMENYNDVEPGYELDGKDRDAGSIGRLQDEKDKRKMWRYVYGATHE